MEKFEHLKLPIFKDNIERKKRKGGGGYTLPSGRNKTKLTKQAKKKIDELTSSYSSLKKKFSGKIDPSLIYEIEINQRSVSPDSFETSLSSMGIHILSIAKDKKGYWVVFSEDEDLNAFKDKLSSYGSLDGPKYEFFNAIQTFNSIPISKKISQRLKDNPLTELADFLDIELWKMIDSQKNELFIQQLKETYTDISTFRITDKLITKSFVLLRVKLTKEIFDEIIELDEIARADRPSIPQFNPFEYTALDIFQIEFHKPANDTTGILIIDSGILSNHPMLEKCVGDEENFQSGENEIQDTVGHGTAVAGCAAYGDIEKCIDNKSFSPSNLIFSAKVMYAEKCVTTGGISATYDSEKLREHQLKEAVESFLSSPDYHIKVVNLSLGNSNEIWDKHYSRQLPLAALIDELAFTFPDVLFIVSAGNQYPRDLYDSIHKIKDDFPKYLINNVNYNIINPATSALAFTVGSIAGDERIEIERYGAEKI